MFRHRSPSPRPPTTVTATPSPSVERKKLQQQQSPPLPPSAPTSRWITGQIVVDSNEHSEKTQVTTQKHHQRPSCCNSRPSSTKVTLVFRPVATTTKAAADDDGDVVEHHNKQQQQQPDVSCPFAGYWHRMKDLDESRQLRDLVESDILVAKHVPWHPYVLPHVDTQLVLEQEANVFGGGVSAPPPKGPNSSSSKSAFLLHVTEFCNGGSLMSLVREYNDRRKRAATSEHDHHQQHVDEDDDATTTLHHSSASGLRGSHHSIPAVARAASARIKFLLPLPVACRLTKQLLEAVAHLHRHGVAHNAVCLHNVFLDADNNVRLGNFSHASVINTNSNSPAPSTRATTTKTSTVPLPVPSRLKKLDERNTNIIANTRRSTSAAGSIRKAPTATTPSPRVQQQKRAASSSLSPSLERSRRGELPPQSPPSTAQRSCCKNNNNDDNNNYCDMCIPPPEKEQQQQEQASSPSFACAGENDVFNCGVVCYELLFGSGPPQVRPTKTTRGDPETSLGTRLVALKENTTKGKQQEHGEVLCRFLLSSLTLNPETRASAEECVELFSSLVASSSSKNS